MTHVPFVTVEGPIGVGKTSLAKEIANHLQFHFLGEIVEENPFLNKFYTNIEEWSFQTEMFFLCNRYKQLEDISKKYLHYNKPVVADYHILKNLIFAERTLHKQQLSKYHGIYSILTADMPAPNVIIYLTASLETLQKRITMRGREFEKDIAPEYLLQLIADYETTMKRLKETHPEVPILTYNGDHIDFVSNKGQLQMMLTDLHNTLQKGRY